MAKLTKKKFLDTTASQIGKMTAPELRQLLRGARQLFNAQEKTFQRQKNLYSHALDKMQTYYDETGKSNVNSMRVNKMRSELFRLQEFFDSKSSTVPGARKIAIEQDRRIFGEDSKGKPARRMTMEQREKFWAAYTEFQNTMGEAFFRRMGSDRIQQFLGQMTAERRGNPDSIISEEAFEELYRRLSAQNERDNWEMSNYEYGDDDVLSGKRPY